MCLQNVDCGGISYKTSQFMVNRQCILYTAESLTGALAKGNRWFTHVRRPSCRQKVSISIVSTPLLKKGTSAIPTTAAKTVGDGLKTNLVCPGGPVQQFHNQLSNTQGRRGDEMATLISAPKIIRLRQCAALCLANADCGGFSYKSVKAVDNRECHLYTAGGVAGKLIAAHRWFTSVRASDCQPVTKASPENPETAAVTETRYADDGQKAKQEGVCADNSNCATVDENLCRAPLGVGSYVQTHCPILCNQCGDRRTRTATTPAPATTAATAATPPCERDSPLCDELLRPLCHIRNNEFAVTVTEACPHMCGSCDQSQQSSV